MKYEILIPLVAILIFAVGIPIFFFIEGLKIKKQQRIKEANRRAAKKAEIAAKKFNDDRMDYLSEKLRVPGIAPPPEFNKKYKKKSRGYRKSNK